MSATKVNKREALSACIAWVQAHEERMLVFAEDPELSIDARAWKMSEHLHAKRARQWLVLVEQHYDHFVRVLEAEYRASERKNSKG